MILGFLLLIAFTAGAIAIAKHANRPVSTGRGGKGGRSTGGNRTGGRAGAGAARKPSWVLRAWNASGAPKTGEATLGAAAAVVTGKAAGRAARGTAWLTRKAGRSGRWAAAIGLTPLDRWLTKKQAGLETAAALPERPNPSEDVIHDSDPPREPDNRTIRDFTSEELLFTPRGRLALKEHELEEMTEAFEKVRADGDVDAEVEAEHMANRRRLEREIADLRRTPNTNPVPEPRQEQNPMTIGALYEAGDAVAAQKFEGVVAVERFLKAVADGCESVTQVWTRWAERLAGPLNVDETVVEHIRNCAPHQASIAGIAGEGATYVTRLLDGSITDALERGQDVPHHKLMDSGGGYPAVPDFYEKFGTYITRAHDDIRGELLLMAAVKSASAQQANLFRSTARRLEDSSDINIRPAAEKYHTAARLQDAITAEVDAAHTQFSLIIRMTIRALADSSFKAPNANMHGVG